MSKEWQDKVKNAGTDEELIALIKEIPAPEPRYKPTDSIEFTKLQISD